MLRSALLVLSGNAMRSILMLGRNLLLAYLIPVADYGVAASLTVAIAVVEMVSSLCLQEQIVQSRRGDDPHFQASLHGFQILRGLMSGLALLVLAWPMAAFLNVPEATWGYQLLALVPLLGGLSHLDGHRVSRRMKFGPMIITGVVPALVSLLAMWPLATFFGDWRAMLWSILIHAVLGTITSHLVAERPYRLSFDRDIIAGSLRFGWPLMANNLLIFLAFNGDRIIVGRALGMEALAILSMGVTLTLTPAIIVARSLGSIFLPRLSAANLKGGKDQSGFARLAADMTEIYVLMAMTFVLAAVLLGPAFVHFALGEKYAALADLIVLMTILHSLRLLKEAPSIIALSLGLTSNALIANLPRALFLGLAWVLAYSDNPMEKIILAATAAEVVGAIIAFALLGRRSGVSAAHAAKLVGFLLAFYALALVHTFGMALPGFGDIHDLQLALLGLMTAVIVMTVHSSKLADIVRQRWLTLSA